MTGGVLNIAPRIWEVGVAGSPVIGRRRGRSQHYCGNLDCGFPLVAFWQQKQTQNVSEYMLVLALCLVLCYVMTLFHHLLLLSYLYHCIWRAITVHNLSPEKQDNIFGPTL